MKFSLVMSRTSSSETPYRVVITDEDSRVKLELTLTAEQFAEAFTGLHAGSIEGRLLGDPSNIGKTKVREDRSIVLSFREKEKVKQYLEAHHQEDGRVSYEDWECLQDKYLDLQRDFEKVKKLSLQRLYGLSDALDQIDTLKGEELE